MLEYREARKDDAKALLAYKKQVFDESEFLSRPGSEYQVTVEEEAEGIVSMTCTENALIWLAIEKEEVVGCLNIRPYPLQREKHKASIGLSVKKSCRGQGIGKKLMQKAIEFFEASPLHRLELTVVKDNVQAVTLYKKLGFREEGIMKDGIKQNQTYYDILVMAMVKEDTK